MIQIKLWLAGNFPQLSDPRKEQQMIDRIREYGGEYKRLISFFYKEEMMTVVGLKRKELEDGGTKAVQIRARLVKRKRKCGAVGEGVEGEMQVDKKCGI